MNPCYVAEVQLYQGKKIFGKKWKAYECFIFDRSEFGVARIELYSPGTVKKKKAERYFILRDLLSMKKSKDDLIDTLILHFTDDTLIELKCSDMINFSEILSKVAFPKEYVTLSSLSLGPSTSVEELSVIDEQIPGPHDPVVSYPVLIQAAGKDSKIVSGNYSLIFDEELILKNGVDEDIIFNYSNITWVATGENCFGFNDERRGVYELICNNPLSVMDRFRQHIRFSCRYTPVKLKTACVYNRYFHPAKAASETSAEMSANSTLESRYSSSAGKTVDRSNENINYTIKEFQPKATSTPKETNEMKKENDNSVVINLSKQIMSSAAEEQLLKSIQVLEKRDSNTLFGVFRRSFGKKKSGGRTDFEENADCEWTRIDNVESPPDEEPRKFELTPGLERGIKYRDELEAKIRERNMRAEEMQKQQQDLLTTNIAIEEETIPTTEENSSDKIRV